MRGFIEVKTECQGAPVKVNVAAWLKIGRTSGTEYLSLKVGNNNPEEPRILFGRPLLWPAISTGGGDPHALFRFHRGRREDGRG